MHLLSGIVVALVGATVPACLAQTFTDCDPTKKTCPPNPGLKTSTFVSDFTKGESASAGWKTTSGKIDYSDKGAAFTINKRWDAPTIGTEFYIFGGYVEVKMKAAFGRGVVSSIVLQSDNLDEVDWEFLGGNSVEVQTNYFGKGNTTTYDRMIAYPVSKPQEISHTYAVDWTSESITWIIDGVRVRTLLKEQANGGKNFPQTPMNVRLGIWAGGDPSNSPGTIEWAGGETDFTKTPYTMYVESVKITNYAPASAYNFTDRSGSWESIEIINDSETTTTTTTTATASATSTETSSTETHETSLTETHETHASEIDSDSTATSTEETDSHGSATHDATTIKYYNTSMTAHPEPTEATKSYGSEDGSATLTSVTETCSCTGDEHSGSATCTKSTTSDVYVMPTETDAVYPEPEETKHAVESKSTKGSTAVDAETTDCTSTVDSKPVETTHAVYEPEEEKPAEEKPVEEKPVEEKPVEETPVEEYPVDVKPEESKPEAKSTVVIHTTAYVDVTPAAHSTPEVHPTTTVEHYPVSSSSTADVEVHPEGASSYYQPPASDKFSTVVISETETSAAAPVPTYSYNATTSVVVHSNASVTTSSDAVEFTGAAAKLSGVGSATVTLLAAFSIFGYFVL